MRRQPLARLCLAMLALAGAGALAVARTWALGPAQPTEAQVGSAVIAVSLFAVLGLAALLGLLRLKVRGMTIASCGLLALGAGGGFATLALLNIVGPYVAIAAVLCGAALLGQLVTTQLLPDSNHPWVVAEQARLASLPPARRRRYVATRVAAGLGLAALAAGATLVSKLYTDGPVWWFWGGSFALGLSFAAAPLVAAVRLVLRR